jgi:hypothetical protein
MNVRKFQRQNGKKEIVVTSTNKDVLNYDENKELVVNTKDNHGEIAVTTVAIRKISIHKNAKKGLNCIDTNGKFLYRGFIITNSQCSEYETEQGHRADTLNELLHLLYNHYHLSFAQEQIDSKGETLYENHSIKTYGTRYVVNNNDSTFYYSVLDALHAIDQKRV